jgi:endonuclease YncB( thermonuclease family)
MLDRPGAERFGLVPNHDGVPDSRGAGEARTFGERLIDSAKSLLQSPPRKKTFTFEATVVRWLDGDTAELEFDLGFKVSFKSPVRLLGASCRELHGPDPVAASRAKVFVLLLAPVASQVKVDTTYDRSFERYLGSIVTQDGKDVAQELIKAGLAVAKPQED